MAKRFTDSAKWKDAWFMDLPSKYKLFWLFILDECDHAGIWKVNFRYATAIIGENLEISECKRYLKDRAFFINDEYWFIGKFLKFQYPNGLNEKSKIHKSIIQILDNHNLIQRVTKGFRKGYLSVQDKDKDTYKDKVKDKDKDKANRTPAEIEFLEYCANKVGEEKFRLIEEALRLKYLSWIENGWKDGYNKTITNWKTKILNTIPHLKETRKEKPKKTHEKSISELRAELKS